MDDDVCHDRQCWATLNGEFVDEMRGGLAAPTSYPARRGQAIDLWFDRDREGGFDKG